MTPIKQHILKKEKDFLPYIKRLKNKCILIWLYKNVKFWTKQNAILLFLQGSCISGKLKNIPGYLNGAKTKENISFVVYM